MRSADLFADAAADVKATEALLRDARSALRRVDTLASQALALEDGTVPLIAEAREALEHVVRQLTHRREDERRRVRAAIKGPR